MKSRSSILFPLFSLISLALLPGVRGQTTASLTVVHSFSALDGSGDNSDGASPIAGVIMGTDGNFYGTANGGGSRGGGVIYRLAPAGTLTTVYAFGNSGNLGDHPYGDVIQGKDGNYYGTNDAGSEYSSGTVYQLTADGTLNPLHTFGGSGNGALPRSSLVEGRDGNFYGTTRQGGTGGDGTVFQITSAGSLATLYNFGKSTGHGSYPRGSLVQGTDGNFYGTTETGGDNGEGTVFQITSAGVLTTLYSYGATGSLGLNPYAGLTQGSDGNFYGVTSAGGTNGNGTVFQLTPGGALTTLYSFSAAGTSGFNADGIDPKGSLLEAAAGTFNGMINQGGIAGEGTIFQLTVSPTITSAVSATGSNGTAFSYQIAATFSPTSFGATGLPAGLSIDSASGVISGTPTAAGAFNVGLSVGNAGGGGTATLVQKVVKLALTPGDGYTVGTNGSARVEIFGAP